MAKKKTWLRILLMRIRGEKIVLSEDGKEILEDANKTAKISYPYGEEHWENQQRNGL